MIKYIKIKWITLLFIIGILYLMGYIGKFLILPEREWYILPSFGVAILMGIIAIINLKVED